MHQKRPTGLIRCRHRPVYQRYIDLVNEDVYTQFGRILSIRSQGIEKKQNLTSIKGRYLFANLRKTMIYITDVDLDNDNEYT